MKKISTAILATMARCSAESRDGFFDRADLHDMVLSSGTGWANRAIAHLLHTDRIAQSGPFFVLTAKGAAEVR